MKRAIVFIDGQYMRGVVQQKVDFEKFCDKICEREGAVRLLTYYYTALPIKNPTDTTQYDKMYSFCKALSCRPRFKIRLGQLNKYDDGTLRQKRVDGMFAVDLVSAAYEKDCEIAIIIAGDSDFIPAIEKAMKSGMEVVLLYKPGAVHPELFDYASKTYDLGADALVSESFMDNS